MNNSSSEYELYRLSKFKTKFEILDQIKIQPVLSIQIIHFASTDVNPASYRIFIQFPTDIIRSPSYSQQETKYLKHDFKQMLDAIIK